MEKPWRGNRALPFPDFCGPVAGEWEGRKSGSGEAKISEISAMNPEAPDFWFEAIHPWRPQTRTPYPVQNALLMHPFHPSIRYRKSPRVYGVGFFL